MLDALAKSVLECARENFDLRGREEGVSSDGWLAIDLGDIVVHLFSPDQRDYYRLEQLWERGKILLRVQ